MKMKRENKIKSTVNDLDTVFNSNILISALTLTSDSIQFSEVATIQQIDSAVYKLKPRLF